MADERAIPGGAGWGQLGGHHLSRYVLAGDFVKGKRVLDAGTGAGYGAALLASLGAREVVGVDLDQAAIEQARKDFGSSVVSFAVSDCETLTNVQGPFDLITSFENIEHLQHPEKFLHRAAALLAPQGLLLVSTPDRANSPPEIDGHPANPYHVREWHREEFTTLLQQHFQTVDMRVQVQTYALAAREQAVQSLKQALTWNNPLTSLLWRKLAKTQNNRSWHALENLAAANPTDYPIVNPATASVYGKSYCHLAICSTPFA